MILPCISKCQKTKRDQTLALKWQLQARNDLRFYNNYVEILINTKSVSNLSGSKGWRHARMYYWMRRFFDFDFHNREKLDAKSELKIYSRGQKKVKIPDIWTQKFKIEAVLRRH